MSLKKNFLFRTDNFLSKKSQQKSNLIVFWNVLNDLIGSKVYKKTSKSQTKTLFSDSISFTSFDFLFFNPSLFNLKNFIAFLKLLLKFQKTVLFLGLPVGLNKEFATLAEKNKCAVFTPTTLKRQLYVERCLFSNLSIFKRQKFGLIFIFDFELFNKYKCDILKLNIPLSGFLTPNIALDVKVDYPLFFNTQSFKGSLFSYNLFFLLFKNLVLKKKKPLTTFSLRRKKFKFFPSKRKSRKFK